MSKETIISQQENETKIKGSVVVIPQRWKYKGEEFFMGFGEAMIKLAIDSDLTGKDKSVLLYILGICGFENKVEITLDDLATALNMKKTNIARSIKKITEKKYINKTKNGKFNSYQVNPLIAWKGNLKKRHRLITLFEENNG